jgi:phosphopantetheine adenylyltransferase
MNKNLYLTSVNPMHNSHLNTLKIAETMLGEEVVLGICKNELNDNGLFSLEERKFIAETFFDIPSGKILILDSKEKIVAAIQQADKIIRGARSKNDLSYSDELAKVYNVEAYKSKLVFIDVPEEMKEISSSRLVALIKEDKYSPELNWIPKKLLSFIGQKIHN